MITTITENIVIHAIIINFTCDDALGYNKRTLISCMTDRGDAEEITREENSQVSRKWLIFFEDFLPKFYRGGPKKRPIMFQDLITALVIDIFA